jgi:hypothetical protein
VLGKLIKTSQNKFRGRGQRVYIINAGWVIQKSFHVFMAYVDELTRQKIEILGSDYKTKLSELFDGSQLEVKFGGNLADKKVDFWPPQMPPYDEPMLTK